MPFFSIIIPTYNRRNFVCAAIQSVLDQSFQDFEIIVVDDGSTDDTGELILSSFQDVRLRFFVKANEGASEARNFAFQYVLGQWVVFLDSDDLWQPLKLENVYRCIQTQAGVDFIHTAHTSDRSLKQCLNLSAEQLRIRQDQISLLGTFLVKTSTLAIDSSLIKDESIRFGRLKTCGDYVFFWKLLCCARCVYFINSCDTIVRFSGNNLTVSKKMTGKFLDNIRAIDVVQQWMLSREIQASFQESLLQLRYWQVRNLFSSAMLELSPKIFYSGLGAAISFYGLAATLRIFANALMVCLKPSTRAWLMNYSLQQYE